MVILGTTELATAFTILAPSFIMPPCSLRLPERHEVTYYAVLGDGPAWDRNRKAVVALAYTDRQDAVSVIRLYDAATNVPSTPGARRTA